jgi:hypothetical protein
MCGKKGVVGRDSRLRCRLGRHALSCLALFLIIFGSIPLIITWEGPVALKGIDLSKTRSPHSSPRDDRSSVDYIACCGLGHRLVRMADAFSIRTEFFPHFDFRVFWGWCGNGEEGVAEVFANLFGATISGEGTDLLQSSPIDHDYFGNKTVAGAATKEINGNMTELLRGHRVRFLNEVGNGFRPLRRTGSVSSCPCQAEKIASDLKLYSSLRDRFRHHKVLDEFCERHDWDHHFVIGLHIRAGNGEGGDFAKKGRQIVDDPDAWLQQVVQHLQDLWELQSKLSPGLPPPLLFVATDTVSLLDDQSYLQTQEIMPVVDWAQDRRGQGTGVFFGQTGEVSNRQAENQAQCLGRWQDAVGDMFLLSRADLVVAGRPSSFVQTLPMSLALGRPKQERKIEPTYCEIIDHPLGAADSSIKNNMEAPSGNSTAKATTLLHCFSSYLEWCCQHPTWVPEQKEFVHFVPPHQEKGMPKILMRPEGWEDCYPRPGFRAKKWCLPQEWKSPLF